MTRLILCLGFFISILAISAVPIPGSEPGGLFFDSLESEGKLEFSLSQSKETLEFGKLQSAFGMGLIFFSKNLPKNFSKSIGNQSIIQISLGNRNPSENQITQFGSLSIKTSALRLKKPLEVLFQDINQKNAPQRESVFLVINPSRTIKGSTDTEKLQGTFFSEQGKLQVSPKGKIKIASFKVEGQYLRFRKQTMTLVLDAKLGSPFSDDKGQIKGSIDIPFFWPAEPAADKWIKKIAQNSLEVFPEISPSARPKRVLASPQDSKK